MTKVLSAVGLLVVVAIGGGCSRSPESGPPPSARSEKTSRPVTPSLPSPAAVVTNDPSATIAATEPVSADQLEVDYLEAPDLASKISALEDLSATEPSAALAVLGRLFYFERDNAMREEILNQLTYIDGAEAAKIELLTEAVKANEPASVRYAAVDVMVEEGDLSAIAVLQSLLKDADPGMRDAAENAIEELRGGK